MKIFTMEHVIYLRVNISINKRKQFVVQDSFIAYEQLRCQGPLLLVRCSEGERGHVVAAWKRSQTTLKQLEERHVIVLGESKLSLCLSSLGTNRRGPWERGQRMRTLQASARANPLPSRITRCHGNFLDMVLNSSRPDGSLFTIENIPARINLTNPDQN